MKREKRISCLIAAILAFCISFGGTAGIITGFSLNLTDGSVSSSFYTEPADLMVVMLFCAVFSVAAAVAFSFRRGGWILLGVLAVLLGYLWRIDVLEVSVEAVLYRITYTYDLAYRCGLVKWTGAYSPEVSPNLGFCILAGIAALVTAWTICRRKNAIPAALCCCVLLGTCLIVTDTVPAAWCLFLLLTGLVLLVLTNTVRRQNALDGNRLTALMLVPALLFVLIMFWAVPNTGYEPSAGDFQKMLAEWLQSFTSGGIFDSGLTGTSSGVINLATAGPKTELYYAVMDVKAADNGMLYLRGQSLDVYDGKSWDASAASTGQDSGWPTQNMTLVGTVSISVRSSHGFKFFPYYSGGVHWPSGGIFKEGRISNPYNQRTYSFTQSKITGPTDAILSGELREQCLELPYNTKIRAADIVKSIGNMTGKSNWDIAAAIGEFVSNSAEYDLNTQRMPSSESDFAIWFLQEASSGYCVHFASAAVVLLRAAGIPARYVSGYAVRASAGETVTVTANRAHAWVEYFVPEVGWTVLDPTPGSWYSNMGEITDPTETTPLSTDTTEPSAPPDIEPTEPNPEPTGPDTEPTLPDGNIGGGSTPMNLDLGWLWEILKWLGILLGVCTAVFGQYLLRLRLRQKRMHAGHPNQRALARWRMVLRMSRLIKEEPPEQLHELAEKAKFSQHTITVAERMEFDQYLNQADIQLNQKPKLKRWLIRLIWAV